MRVQFGFGEPSSVANLADVFDGSRLLIWADGTQGTGDPSALSIISHITKEFNDKQLDAVKQVPSRNDIRTACPQNFLLSSGCFAAISFEALPKNGSARRSFNYSILADGGLTHIDVPQHASDYERRIMPIQWAVDSVSEHPYIIHAKTWLMWLHGRPSWISKPAFKRPGHSNGHSPLLTIKNNTRVCVCVRLHIPHFWGVRFPDHETPGYVRGIRKLLVLALCASFDLAIRYNADKSVGLPAI
jgi:hypothetical protein